MQTATEGGSAAVSAALCTGKALTEARRRSRRATHRSAGGRFYKMVPDHNASAIMSEIYNSLVMTETYLLR